MTARLTPIPKICEYCGTSFLAQKSTTRFCSHTCNSRSYKKRLRNQTVEQATQESIALLNTEMERIKAREFLNIDQCSKLLGISRFTVMKLIKLDMIAVFKAGRRTIISRESIDKHFKHQ